MKNKNSTLHLRNVCENQLRDLLTNKKPSIRLDARNEFIRRTTKYTINAKNQK
tara:strand:+ start:120 stop:278 length:159 start_codon:yes stop_codon:yes gene_type:complete